MDDQQFRTRDDVDDAFAEAVVHKKRHKVLGFYLRPFSFWHAANLDFIESPFAGHRKEIDFAALYLAARACRLRYPRTLRHFKGEYFVELWKARRYRYVKIGGASSRESNSAKASQSSALQFPFIAELSKFSAYLRDYASRPEYITEEQSTPARTPWYLFEVAVFKRYNPELSWAQSWNTPIGVAAWFNAAMHEANGNKIELVTPEYRKAFREAGLE